MKELMSAIIQCVGDDTKFFETSAYSGLFLACPSCLTHHCLHLSDPRLSGSGWMCYEMPHLRLKC
jgi:hypothetical protein